jgi:hypothetical protein
MTELLEAEAAKIVERSGKPVSRRKPPSRKRASTSSPRANTDDPLRAALADEIKQASAAKIAVAKRRAGIERLWDEERGIEKQVETLQKRAREAAEVHIANLAEAAALEKAAPASGVPKARQAVTVAEDHRDSLRLARRKIEAELPKWEADAVRADTEVERLISELLKPYAERLIKRGEEIAAQLAPVRAALTSLWAENSPQAFHEMLPYEQSRQPLKDTKQAVADFLRDISAFSKASPDPWRIARDALKQNAQAELPTELTALLGSKTIDHAAAGKTRSGWKKRRIKTKAVRTVVRENPALTGSAVAKLE